jgi:sRNA-binding protein
MPLCIALVQSSDRPSYWDRCGRCAQRGDQFCASHRQALDGAVMGFLDTESYRHAQAKHRRKELRATLSRIAKKSRGKTRPGIQKRKRPKRRPRNTAEFLEEYFRN